MNTERQPGDTGPSEDGERLARIRAVIAAVERERADGGAPSDEEIERRHAELMPELGEHLRALREIQAAVRGAGRWRSSIDAMDGGADRTQEDVRFLSEALPNYAILERVDYGGQGVVYKAAQRATQRIVAIKVLLDGPLATERQRQRLAREAELISRLDHPNIVTLYDSGFVRSRPYFAMEYVDGLPIDDYALLHGLTVTQIVRLFVTVCEAVSHAHQQGVIHRDLNPSNILVTQEGVPHVLDFGLAKDAWGTSSADDGPTLTLSGQVVGTLPYMSPEQAGGEATIDVRSDIYSLAVVLYELLSGRYPYPLDGTAAEVRARIIQSEPQPLRKALPPERSAEVSAAVIRDLEMILRKALSKEKEARYQSAAALAEDLRRCLAGDPVEARAGSRLYLLQRTFRKYRAAAAVAAVLALMGGAWAVSASLLWLEVRSQRDRAVEAVETTFATLGDVLTRVDEQIAPLAGGMETRSSLLSDVVAPRLEALRPLVESDAAMHGLRGALYEKQGDIAYAEGRHADARRHYAEWLRVLEAGGVAGRAGAAGVLELARAHRKLALVSDEAEEHFERAIKLGREAVSRSEDSERARFELCEALVEYGQYLSRSGYFERASEQLSAAVDIASLAVGGGRDGDSAEIDRWSALLARALEWRGDMDLRLGNGERGVAALSESWRIRRELCVSMPADATRRHHVLKAGIKLSRALTDDGQLDEAESVLNEAVTHGEYLVSVDPTVAVWCRDLFGARYDLATLRLVSKDIDGARAACDAAMNLAQMLVERNPDDHTWQSILAYGHVLRGRVALEAGRPVEGMVDFRSALDVRERLSESDPDDLGRRTQVEHSHYWVGLSARLAGDVSTALIHYRRALEISEALLVIQPDVTQRAIDVIRNKTNLAVAHAHAETAEDDRMASELLREANLSLAELHGCGKLAAQSQTYLDLNSEIELWLNRLDERFGQRAASTPASSD